MLSVAIICLATSCEKVFMDDMSNSNSREVFDEVWQFIDRNYSYFDYKNVDWNELYDEYSAQIDEGMTDEDLFNVLARMLYRLHDGHVNLTSDFDRSRNWTWFLEADANFSYDLIERAYFSEEQQIVGPFIVYDFGEVGYVYNGDFSNSVEGKHLDYIIDKFSEHKGMIIDVRDNGGGILGNARRWASRYTSESVLVGKRRERNGLNHNDFTAWHDETIDSYLTDYEGSTSSDIFLKPVVVLTNRSCYSTTNYFVQYMNELENVTIVGDKTGGGSGIPTYKELSNGWLLRVSATQFVTPEGIETEGGIEPDIHVQISAEDWLNQRDTILEFALTLFD